MLVQECPNQFNRDYQGLYFTSYPRQQGPALLRFYECMDWANLSFKIT